MGDTVIACCFGCCFLVPTFVLQAVGFFSPNWASNASCDSLGLFYHCCGGDSNDSCESYGSDEELDNRVLGLQATSFTVMILTVVGLCGAGICNKDDDDDDLGYCGMLGGCCFVCYPVAGLLSVIGCIILATKYSTSELGYSFYLCVTSGSFVLLLTVCFCCLMCYALKDDDEVGSRGRPSSGISVVSEPRGGNMGYRQNDGYDGGSHIASYQPSGGQISPYAAQQATFHQATVVHDEESGGVLMFIRRIQITRLVSSFQHSE